MITVNTNTKVGFKPDVYAVGLTLLNLFDLHLNGTLEHNETRERSLTLEQSLSYQWVGICAGLSEWIRFHLLVGSSQE